MARHFAFQCDALPMQTCHPAWCTAAAAAAAAVCRSQVLGRSRHSTCRSWQPRSSRTGPTQAEQLRGNQRARSSGSSRLGVLAASRVVAGALLWWSRCSPSTMSSSWCLNHSSGVPALRQPAAAAVSGAQLLMAWYSRCGIIAGLRHGVSCALSSTASLAGKVHGCCGAAMHSSNEPSALKSCTCRSSSTIGTCGLLQPQLALS